MATMLAQHLLSQHADGTSCLAMIAVFPSTIMEAAFGRLHNSGAGASGAGSTVVDSIIVDGKVANIAIQLTPSHADSAGVVQAWLPYTCCFGKCSASMVAILLLFQLCQHGGRTPAVSAGVPPGGG